MPGNRAQIIYSVHAIERMVEREISDVDVEKTLAYGKVIESYPRDTPYPSQLMLGKSGTRFIHVVAADNSAEDQNIVVTVYEPDPNLWEPGCERRKRK